MIAVRPPGDKSISHRAVLLAPLASGVSTLSGVSGGADVRASIAAMRALGARIAIEEEGPEGLRVRIDGGHPLRDATGPIDCGNSGTSARLLAGLIAGLGLEAVLDGDASLRRRPMRRVVYPLQAMGARIEYLDEPERLPIRIRRRATGHLRRLRHRPRAASAQVKSAVLLAGVTGRTPVEIVEPRPTRDHSERMLTAMGAPVSTGADAAVRFDPEGWDGTLRTLSGTIPGDPSGAAFLIGAAVFAGIPIQIEGVGANPGRTAYLDVLGAMGVSIDREASGAWAGEPVERWTVVPPEALDPFEIGEDLVPGLVDEIPLLGVLAATAAGRSTVRGASELRVKESDRIAGMVSALNALGLEARERDDGFDIEGRPGFAPAGAVRTHGDHRLAMAFGVLGCVPGADVRVDDPECAAVSFPGFRDAVARIRGAGDAGPFRVIAIDGPAASGKSTTARAVADRLGFAHVNSGLFYRAITWWAVREGLAESDPSFPDRVGGVEIGLAFEEGGWTVEIDGVRPGAALVAPPVADRVSAVSGVPEVRTRVLGQLRAAAARQSLVCDGRDIGTTVFPGADLKVFLVADPAERARRRLLETEGRLDEDRLREEIDRLAARDRADATRAVSPLAKAVDAIEIDTTRMRPDAVVEHILVLARDRGIEPVGAPSAPPPIG